MIVVSDTSVLIYLARLRLLDLLPTLYGRVVIPPAVQIELEQGDPPEPALRHITEWLEVAAPRDLAKVEMFAHLVDQGEAEAIALALELSADLLLIDDGDGRSFARAQALRAQGLIGVILDAKRAGVLPAVRPELDRLRDLTTFRMSHRVYTDALRRAGEIL